MVNVCIYFQVHKAVKLNNFRVFDIGHNRDYFDDEKTRNNILKVARECYIPTNKVLLDLIKTYGKKFKVTFSISGITLEILEKYAPEILESFKELAATGCIEFLAETYYHSLSFLYSKQEFQRQIDLHNEAIKKHFNQEPKVFRNTELIYSNELASFIENIGFDGIFCEEESEILGWRTPNQLYKAFTPKSNTTLFVRNKKLSNDIMQRFSNREWSEYPLTADKYVKWITNNPTSQIVNLFMDYETFGTKHQKSTGIFDFLENFVHKILSNSENTFVTPSEAIRMFPHKEKLDVPFIVSWGDERNDLHKWLGNKMQKSASEEMFAIETYVKNTKNKDLLIAWRRLTNSDNFQNMDTSNLDNGRQDPEINPYDSYIHFMNILNDLIIKIKLKEQKAKTQMEILKNSSQKGILRQVKMAIKES